MSKRSLQDFAQRIKVKKEREQIQQAAFVRRQQVVAEEAPRLWEAITSAAEIYVNNMNRRIRAASDRFKLISDDQHQFRIANHVYPKVQVLCSLTTLERIDFVTETSPRLGLPPERCTGHFDIQADGNSIRLLYLSQLVLSADRAMDIILERARKGAGA